MKILVLVGIAVALAGCGPSRQSQISQQVDAEKAVCDASQGAKKFKTRVEYARCLNAAEAPLASTFGSNGDLFSVRLALRTSIAERMDRGELTPAEAELEGARSLSSLTSEFKRRNNAEEAVAASYRPVTCNKFGYSVTCF